MDELDFARQFVSDAPPTVNDVLARALMADRDELAEARKEREAEAERQAARENMALANRQMGDPLGHVTRCQAAVAEARDKVRDLESQLGQARQVLHRAGEAYVDWSEAAEQVTAATARRSNDPDLLAGAKQALAAASVERMLAAPRPARRPFASRGSVTRSESCVWCIEQNVSDHDSYLLHSDPELAVPVTTPEQAGQRKAEHADRRSQEGRTPMIYR